MKNYLYSFQMNADVGGTEFVKNLNSEMKMRIITIFG